MRKNFGRDISLFMFLLLTVCLFVGVKIGKAESTSLNSSSPTVNSVAKTEINSLQLYVYPIKLDKPVYSVGNDATGVFTLSNISNSSLQDGYYTVSIGNNNDEVGSTTNISGPTNESSRISIPYVKENSKRDIKFNYGLSKNISGNTNLVITIYLQDGTVITKGYQKIYIQGESQFKITNPSNISVLKNGVVYDKDYGLIIEAKDKLSIYYALKLANQTSVSLKIYTANNNVDAIESINSTLDKTDKDGKYSLDIPTNNLAPGKYLARIEFTDVDSYAHPINPITINFVIDGLISHIKAVTSDKFSLSKDEKFNLSINYEGYGKTRDSDIQKRMSGASLYLTVKNENDVDIFNIELPIDLSQYDGSINVPAQSKDKAEYLDISTEIRDGNGVVVSSYLSSLPSEKEADLLYPKKESGNSIYYVFGILLLIILSMIISFKNKKRIDTGVKKNSRKKLPIAIIIITILFFSAANTSFAFTSTDVLSSGDASLSDAFSVNGVSSPLPSVISFYNPGDTFNVDFLINKSATLNTSVYYLLPPDQNNWNGWEMSGISIDKMVLSKSVNITSSKNYQVPNTPGLYNFTFYVAVADSAKVNFIIKKITQPVLVLLPSNQLIGDGGTLAYAGQSTPQATTCDNSHSEGEKICDSGTPGVWNCESTLGACTMNSVPVAGGLIISGGTTVSGSSLDVRANISSIVNGDKFYVITDLQNSDWVDKEYAYTEFTFGIAKTVVYQPYSRKSNKHTVSYDGVNSVVATSQYVGKSSKFTNASVTIKEVGSLVPSTVCRNIPESEISRMFNTPNSLISIPLCSYPKYTMFSNGINSYGISSRASGGNNSRGRTASLSINVCNYMPSLADGEQFYIVIDSNGTSWINTRYDMFYFSKGSPKSSTFAAVSKKYNVITGSYDGGCTVNFSSQHAGKKSDYTVAQMNIIELGPWDSKMCYYSGTPYSWNFNRGNWTPPLSQCQGNNEVTCTTGDTSWKLNQDTGTCTNFLSCIFKNSKGENIYAIPVGEKFSFDANFATSGNLSLLDYFWNFGDGSNPNSASTKDGSLSYDTPGEKIAELQVSSNNVVLEQGQCPVLSVDCPSGDCSNLGAGCGISEVSNDQGLDNGSFGLCPAGQTNTGFSVSTAITRSNPSVWSWTCKSSTSEKKCSAKCKAGLNYCADTGKCSSSCKGDKCPFIDGIQTEENPIYSVAQCVDPKLKMKLTFDKPYADEATSKCSVSWIPKSSLSDLNYTVCKLDGADVNNTESKYQVFVGQHKLSCVTKVVDSENPSFSLSSNPSEVNFRCSRVPKTTEN